jgi:hydroxymethylbilane synthase
LKIETEIITTSADRIQDRPLHELGGKGLFTREIEQALIDGRIDFAVHSFKDLPVTMPLVDTSNLVIAATPPRADPRDVVVMRDPSRGPFPHNARVGTSSLRRTCQILEAVPGATILPLRGNIDTRIRKLREGQFDVIVLAMAGLKRAGLFDASYMQPIEPEKLLPAPGQGALAVQCRADDMATRDRLQILTDPATATCVEAERAVVAALNGDCHSPIAALATIEHGSLMLNIAVGARDGRPPVLRARANGDLSTLDRIVADAVEDVRRRGAVELLRGCAQYE